MKKWIKITGISFLVVIGVVLVTLRLYKDTIRLKIEREIDSRVDAIVSYSDQGLSFWRHFPNLTLSLEDLVIAGKEEFAKDTLLSVAQLHLEVSLLQFLSGEIRLKSIHFVNPVVFARVLPNGKANYLIFDSKPSSTVDTTGHSGFNVQIDNMVIDRGEVIYQDAFTRTNFTITDLNHKGKGDFSQDVFDYETTTSVGEFSLSYDNVPYLDKKNLSFELAIGVNTKTRTFKVLRNTARINHFKFGLEGYATILKEGFNLDLKFASQETAFKNILSLLPGMFMEDMEHISTGGEASLSGFVKGRYVSLRDSIPSFHVDLKVKDGTFKVDSLPATLNNIQFDLVLDNNAYRLDSTIFDLRNFHFDIGDQPVHGRIKVKGINQFKVDADVLARLNLHEIETIYTIPGIDMKGHLDLEFKAKGDYRPSDGHMPSQIPRFSFNMKLTNGHLHYDSLPAAIDDINMHVVGGNGTGNLDNTSFYINHLKLRLDDNLVTGQARIDGFSNPHIESDLMANLDLADLNRIFPMKGYEVKGNLSVDLKMNGTYNKESKLFPVVDAGISLRNGFLKSADYPEPIDKINLTAQLVNKTGEIADSRLSISQFNYTLENEPFTVSGLISDFDKYHFDFKMKGRVDLEKLTKVYSLEPWIVKGIVTSDVETTGTLADVEMGNYRELTTHGTIEVNHFSISGGDIPRPMVIDDALFRLAPQKIVLESLTGKFGKSNISMTGELSNYMSFATANDDLIGGDMVLKCDTLFINEWIPESTQGSGSSDRLVVFEISKNVDFIFDSEVGYVKYDDIKITQLDGEIKLKEGVMSLHETGFNSLDAKFNVTGNYDTRNMAHPIFDFHLDVKELDIQRSYREIKLMRTLAPATADCAGTFSISYDLNGELNHDFFPKTETLKGGGRIRIANAKIEGMKIFEELSKAAKKSEVNDPHLKDFVMDTEIRNNKIFVKPFSIKVSGFNTEVEGVNDISGAIQYLVKIELLPIEKMKIPFHITGTYDNPKVSLGKGATLPE